MEREIPLYSYDGQLLQWVDAKRLDRLVSMDRVSRIVKHPNLKFVARFMNGSDEYTKLKAQTTGTAVVTLAYDVTNSLQLTWQQISYSVVEIAETDQILTVAVECLPMYHTTNGILTAVGKTTVDGICQ